MNNVEPFEGAADLEQAAAEWFFRRDAGLTAGEAEDLEAWLAADPRHAEAFAEIEATWDQSLQVRDRLRAVVPALAAFPAVHPVPEGVSPKASVLRRRSPVLRSLRFALPLAAAAAVAVGYFAWWQPAHYAGTLTTAVGEIRQWPLPDGSTVDLNTDTTVTVAYSFGERRLDLVRGEAHFAVAKDKERPFTVAAGQVSVRAVGTAFNVRRRTEAVDVLVTEGRVSVATQPGTGDLKPEIGDATKGVHPPAWDARLQLASFLLEAGHRVSVPLVTQAVEAVPAAAPAIEPVAPPVMAQSLAWQKRKVEFADASLGEMVKEFNRYNRHQLVIDDPRLAAMRFGGTFPADDYEAFVRVLEGTFGVTSTKRGDATVLRLLP